MGYEGWKKESAPQKLLHILTTRGIEWTRSRCPRFWERYQACCVRNEGIPSQEELQVLAEEYFGEIDAAYGRVLGEEETKAIGE
jgi:hypothetical protein